MYSWLSPLSFVQTLSRVGLVWLSFYGAGKLLRHHLRVDRFLPLIPPETLGMLVFVVFSVLLSVFGLLTRAVCPVLLVLTSLPGGLFVYSAIRDRTPLSNPGAFSIVYGILLAGVLLLNLTYASIPNFVFDDPLITYAVQPDRWLNNGRIYWLEESYFSAFPLLYEMTAVWPASLSVDRIDQLSVLQVFQMSMLIVAVFRGMRILSIKRALRLPVAVIVLLITQLYYWCTLAKTDAMAIMFCTFALTAAVKQSEKDFKGSPLSSWLFMGLALATKQTAFIVLLPFLLYSAKPFIAYSSKWKVLALVSLLAVPGMYGVRTMLKTGSPSYPVHPIAFLLRDEWRVDREPVEISMLNDRSSELHSDKRFSLAKHIGVYYASMEGGVLLLICGLLVALLSRRFSAALVAVPILLYSALSIWILWPPWWGAKYTILIYPFVAFIGVRLLQENRRSLLLTSLVLIPSFVIPGFLIAAVNPHPAAFRISMTKSILTGQWDFKGGYAMNLSTPEGMSHIWANAALPDTSVIFSLHEEKRYFFNGTVIVGWRHPLGQQIYLENTLEEEIGILDSLSVDFVGFYRENPVPGGLEDRLTILDQVGFNEILEPVIVIDGYVLCRYERGRQAASPE